MRVFTMVSAGLLFCTCSVFSEVKVASVFGSGMVLQRELPVPVWGTASPGEKVTVRFAGQHVECTAGQDGSWLTLLAPLETSKRKQTMTVEGDGSTIKLNNVLVGEVWFCSGQSNMADSFRASKQRSLPDEAFEADLSGFRFHRASYRDPDGKGWKALDSNTYRQCSRVSYYFGRKLYDELDIPVGLVIRAHSGTPIQAWVEEETAERLRKEAGIPPGWKEEVGKGLRAPGVQYTKQIAPSIPYCIRGVIWYQGERNAKAMTGWEYKSLLAGLVESWRTTWAERSGRDARKFPFYFVQVPTQGGRPDAEWPWLRDSMRRAVDMIENSGMAVFYDHGPSLHPHDKHVAGERLALWALKNEYGRDLVCSGPMLDKVRITDGKAVLTFSHVGGGLRSLSGGSDLDFFEIAGEDGKYVPADARIEGSTVVVHSPEIKEPAHVRYLFAKEEPSPEVSLINAEGLPASSFITDDFKPPRNE